MLPIANMERIEGFGDMAGLITLPHGFSRTPMLASWNVSEKVSSGWFNLLIINGLERWQSGRMRRFAKPLYGLTPVPRVRIPPSPPVLTIPNT